jgi:hypothetical protein
MEFCLSLGSRDYSQQPNQGERGEDIKPAVTIFIASIITDSEGLPATHVYSSAKARHDTQCIPRERGV